MRLINHKDFEPGPFNLGKFGPIVAVIAVLWVVFLTVSMEALLTCCGACLWVLPYTSQPVAPSAMAHALHCHNASDTRLPCTWDVSVSEQLCNLCFSSIMHG